MRERKRTSRLAAAAVGALALAGLVVPATPAAAATATVGDGLTTTDLTSPGTSPTSLATALVGPGVSVSNVTYSGAPTQAGLIHLVDPAVVSFNDGVILSSGNVADVVGPNKSDGTTGAMGGPADADLTGLIAGSQTVDPNTYDAASLELDFVPTADHVYFTYTFGSDEYLEWVNLFNDVFAFYVNGQNCATVPDGSPVSIDTINDAVNPQLFRDNSYTSPPANPINIESDGLSVEMICSAPVQAGQVNHLKLAIADTSDPILDSVVMIKAHSLSTTPPESCNDGVDNDDDLLVDDSDDSCTTTTTPPPTGGSGVGSGGSAPPFTGNEGTPIGLDASALGWAPTPDTVTTTWTVTGINGTPGTCEVVPAGPQPLAADGSAAVVQAICPNEGEYVAMVDGTDAEGSSAFDKDVDFFVHNAPPAVAIDAPTAGAQVGIGTPLDLSAWVSDPGVADAVTCSIDWGDGTIETGTLVDGLCSGSHAWATPGPRLVSVTATDDAGDSSAAATLVDVVAGTTTLTSSANPSVTGQPVKLTATTTAGTTGTVTFTDGGTALGTATVAAGVATLTVALPTAGTHHLQAVHHLVAGDAGTASPVLDQQVDRAATSTTLTTPVNPSVTGQLVKLKAKVRTLAPGTGTPSGSVSLYDGATLVSTRALSLGTAVFEVRPGVGDHSYTAVYAGSADRLGSATAAPLVQHVNPAATTTTVTSSANPSVNGQLVAIKAKVAAALPGSGIPTGTVAFYDGATLVGSAPLTNGVAAVSLRPGVGTHAYSAVYQGSAAYLGSTGSLSQVVNQASSKVALASPYPTTTLGHSGYISVAVSALAPGSGVPTGSVTVLDGGAPIGTFALVNGKARLAISSLPVGTHVLTATYTGDAAFLGSASTTALVQTIS